MINASGPYQAQDYTLARACIAARCHYIDLADARAFVTGITALDGAAQSRRRHRHQRRQQRAGLVVGRVPRAATPRSPASRRWRSILSPGNHFNPGEATTRSVLGGAGRPITDARARALATVYGWQGLRRRTIAGIGRRWFGYVDVPDLELFPAADPKLQTVRFQAGVEVSCSTSACGPCRA